NAVQFGLRYFLMHWSYRKGTDAISIMTANAKEFTRAASILGIFVVGALTSAMGATSVNIVIPNGEAEINIQSILDGILPSMLPLGLTLLLFYLMQKHKWTPIRCILLLLCLGILGSGIGIWPSIWP
ncbi:MAG: PTS system mannose/fructose/sorbose family transporter subunit IID, partial [Lactococcus sp.]